VLIGGGDNRWWCVEAGRRCRRAAAPGSGDTVEVAEGKQLKETRERFVKPKGFENLREL